MAHFETFITLPVLWCSMKDEEAEYPSIREALSNDSKAVNAYCAFKFVFWQTVFALLTVVGVVIGLIFAIAFLFVFIAEKIYEGCKKLFSPVSNRTGLTTKKIGTAVSNGHEKSKQTPGVRRLWGECPVSFKTPPKWFDKMTDAVDKKL